jgi:hypothetical protein
LALSPRYIANYLYCGVEWDYVDGVVIITMYRPASADWVGHLRRRKP